MKTCGDCEYWDWLKCYCNDSDHDAKIDDQPCPFFLEYIEPKK